MKTIEGKQTVFNYPDKDTSLKVLDLIFNDRTEEAYDILSEFYHVPGVSVIYEPEKGFDSFDKKYNSSGLTVYGYYDFNLKRVNFRMKVYQRMPELVLHEFYHHLETAFGIFGIQTGRYQTADSWAKWFMRSIGDIGDVIYNIQYADSVYLMGILKFLKAVNNEDNIDKVRKLKKGTRQFIMSKDVFYSRKENKYCLTPLGRMMIEYIIMNLDIYETWKKEKECLAQEASK